MTPKQIFSEVNKILLSSAKTPEAAFKYFFANLIAEIERLGNFSSRKITSAKSPFTDRVVKNRILEANLLIKSFDTLLGEKYLEYVELAEKWNIPKDLKTADNLLKLTISFKDIAEQAFSKMSEAAKTHIYSISHVLENYTDLSETEVSELTKIRGDLIAISEMTWKKMIQYLKYGDLEAGG